MTNKVDKCRCCGNPITESMTFGQMPIANAFIEPDKSYDEHFFEMATAFCSNCFVYQLLEQPDAEMMFHENYAFYSRQSKFMQIHFCMIFRYRWDNPSQTHISLCVLVYH